MLLILSLLACRPPEAPTEFDDLAVFLFDNVDGDTAALEDGLDNLSAWLDDNPEEPQDGFAVSVLTDDVVDALVGHDVDLSDVEGAAVVTWSEHSPAAIAEVIVVDDQTAVFPDLFASYDVEVIEGDPESFADQETDWLVLENEVLTTMPLGIEMTSTISAEHRWLESAEGPVAISRTWQNDPADINVNWFHVEEQLYLSVTMPRPDGSTWRVQATWVVSEFLGGSVPEGTALSMAINGLRNKDQSIYEWLDEH